VVATVDGVICGRGSAGARDGQSHFAVVVAADGPGHEGCGQPGRAVTISIGGRQVATGLPWTEGVRRLASEVQP
jgi:hypothetical protein